MEIQPRHVRETRIAAAIALVALAAGAASDFLLDFWARNVMLTSVVANLLVLMVGVAVVNEYLAGRSARRWRLLGQFVLLELGRSARDVWIVLLERLGLEEGRDLPLDELRALVRSDHGSGRIAELADAVAVDPTTWTDVAEAAGQLSKDARAEVARWAPVMTSIGPFALPASRYLELAERLGRLAIVLSDNITGHPTSLPDVGDADWVRRNLSETIALAIILDRDFFEMADAIVPREWWKELEGLDREAHYRYLRGASGRS